MRAQEFRGSACGQDKQRQQAPKAVPRVAYPSPDPSTPSLQTITPPTVILRPTLQLQKNKQRRLVINTNQLTTMEGRIKYITEVNGRIVIRESHTRAFNTRHTRVPGKLQQAARADQ